MSFQGSFKCSGSAGYTRVSYKRKIENLCQWTLPRGGFPRHLLPELERIKGRERECVCVSVCGSVCVCPMGHIRKDNHPTLYVTCLCLNFKEYNDIQCLQLRHKVTKPLGAEWTVGSHWKDSEQRLVILQLKELVFKEFSVTSFSRVNVIAHR